MKKERDEIEAKIKALNAANKTSDKKNYEVLVQLHEAKDENEKKRDALRKKLFRAKEEQIQKEYIEAVDGMEIFQRQVDEAVQKVEMIYKIKARGDLCVLFMLARQPTDWFELFEMRPKNFHKIVDMCHSYEEVEKKRRGRAKAEKAVKDEDLEVVAGSGKTSAPKSVGLDAGAAKACSLGCKAIFDCAEAFKTHCMLRNHPRSAVMTPLVSVWLSDIRPCSDGRKVNTPDSLLIAIYLLL